MVKTIPGHLKTRTQGDPQSTLRVPLIRNSWPPRPSNQPQAWIFAHGKLDVEGRAQEPSINSHRVKAFFRWATEQEMSEKSSSRRYARCQDPNHRVGCQNANPTCYGVFSHREVDVLSAADDRLLSIRVFGKRVVSSSPRPDLEYSRVQS